MPDIEIVGEKVTGGIRVDDKSITLRLHFYDGKFYDELVRIEKNGDKIRIITDMEELIKRLLVRRDSVGKIVWSILQSEYKTLDKIEKKVEKLQNASIHSYDKTVLYDIVQIRKGLYAMHRDYIRMRNIVENAIDEKYETGDMRKILRDVNEMIDIVEYLISGTNTAIELMHSTLSAKMNEVMKILTVIATIMMPLSLVAGIYGMNFRNMPELYWYYGYPYALTLMAVIAAVMLLYFKKRKII